MDRNKLVGSWDRKHSAMFPEGYKPGRLILDKSFEPQPMTIKIDVDPTITAGEIIECLRHQQDPQNLVFSDNGKLIHSIDTVSGSTRLAHMPAPMAGRMRGFFRAHYNNRCGHPLPEGTQSISVNDISRQALQYLEGVISDCFDPDEEIRFEYWYQSQQNFQNQDISVVCIWLISTRPFGANFRFPLRASLVQ